MANTAKGLSDQDFFHSHLAEFLDGELPAAAAAHFEELRRRSGHEQVPEHFQSLRGRLQVALQSFYLKENELAALRALVQDPTAQATEEAAKIESLGRGEFLGTLIRRVALVAIAGAIIGFAVWYFAPRREQTFKALDYVGYEAMAMEEDKERLALPSDDLKEIRQYLGNYPGLDFKPRVLKTMPPEWRPEGATVIDYEIAKVACVQYVNSENKEKLFHFTYDGNLTDLPKAEQGNMRGLIYQTYASSELNIIAFEADRGVVSLLVGHRSAPELAEIALNGTKSK